MMILWRGRAMIDLIKLSRHYGSQSAHVQAGGGNSSQKHDDGMITIKASGAYLRDVSETVGFVTIPRAPVAELFSHATPPSEVAYNTLIQSITPQGASRPSMESGFHTLLSAKYILHTHSVLMNVLLCSDAGAPSLAILAGQFDMVILDYITPGIPLSFAIGQIKNPPDIILMRNHGIIVCGDDIESLMGLYDRVHAAAERILAEGGYIAPPFPDIKIKPCGQGFKSNTDIGALMEKAALFDGAMDKILCPDQAIYFSLTDTYDCDEDTQTLVLKLDEARAFAVEEMAIFVRYIHFMYAKFNWKPCYIAADDIKVLLKLDSEKYRQQK